MANAKSAAGDELLTRGVQEVVPTDLSKQKLQSKKPLRLYFGIDPTGTKLHVGHSVPLLKLQAFAEAGHHAIFLIGSYTAMIGDPTGRDLMRQTLSKEEVEKNFETYKEQASKILDFDKVEIRYNDEWLGKLKAADVLKISSHFTVQQMLQRDMFRERLKKDEDLNPIEFMYPLLQGYDSVMLDVDFEIGGNDQLFNMLCGRKLQQRYGKRDKCVMTTKLIEGIDGRKMSKTYDNCIYLTDSPKDMYGKTLRVEDRLIPIYLECCTKVPMSEVKAVEAELKAGKKNPKELKMRLARELVTMYHGADAAKHAEAEFQAVFAGGGVPEDIPEVKVGEESLLVDVLIAQKLVPSKSEFRRLVEQKGIHVNDKVVTEIDAKIERGVVKVGKRKFLRIS